MTHWQFKRNLKSKMVVKFLVDEYLLPGENKKSNIVGLILKSFDK